MLSTEKALTPSAPARTALVVGGGIIGLSIAFELQTRGLATVVVDAERVRRRASWGNAGHIAVEQVEPLASPATLASFPRRLFFRGGALSLPVRDVGTWLPFALRLLRASHPARFRDGKVALRTLVGDALPAWRRLASRADARPLIVEDGHYVVWESEAGARAGRDSWRSADIGGAALHDLTREELARITGLIGRPPVDGIRFSGTGRVTDPGDLCDRIEAAFVAAGGEFRERRARLLSLERGRAAIGFDDGTRATADFVVIASGVGSGDLLRQVGYRVPIIAERGYHLQAPSAAWPDLPPVVFEERSMIVSRFRSGLRAASFVEFSRENSPPDARKWRRLRSHADALKLPFDETPTEWIGARPTLPDYLPALGRSDRADNLAYAFGHQHLGLTLAAITAEIVGNLAAGHEPPLALGAFCLDRFG
jgi:glycine/D-amino acid oxidase-like deaminating enzyme